MFKKLLYCVFAVAMSATAMAQNIDKVYMANGTEYEGYISEQVPGYKIVISATLATVNISSERISGVSTVKKDIAELDSYLQQWAKTNRPNAKTLDVSSLKIGGKDYQNVVILSNDGSKARLLIAGNERHLVNWDDIVKTTKVPAASSKFGVKEIVTLHNGKTYEGNIIEQVLGKQMSIQADNGKVNVVKTTDVVSIKTMPRATDKDVWAQIPYLDVVKLDDGIEKRGFISAREFGNSIEIITEGQTTAEKIDLAKVTNYRKIANSQYGATTSTQESAPAVATTTPKAAAPATTPKPATPATTPKSAANADKVAEAKPATTTKPAEATPTETKPAENKVAEQPKPAPGATSGFYINGQPVGLSKVAIAATKLSFITKTYVIAPSASILQVSGKQPIIITLPASVDFSDDVYIAKTDKREVILGESETKTSCHTFTKAKAEKSLVGFFTSKKGNSIELKITTIEPGVYALWPIGEATDSCITFEVM